MDWTLYYQSPFDGDVYLEPHLPDHGEVFQVGDSVTVREVYRSERWNAIHGLLSWSQPMKITHVWDDGKVNLEYVACINPRWLTRIDY